MKHLTEEEIVEAYYSGVPQASSEHFGSCDTCRARFAQVRDQLEGLRSFPVPERGESYGREVWARLSPRLPVHRRAWVHWPAWIMAPALVTLVAIAFVAGIWTEQKRQLGVPAAARERVLMAALSAHLERSQILLTELVHATPATADISDERERARDLVNENRLLRQTALRAGDASDAALLDDLERVLLQVANGPDPLRPNELETLQQRMENEGLLFKLRITTTDARKREQTL